ncbi:hypothetical protein WHT83_02595 [Aminobacter sp. P9b]|uniref:Uncharacterized protein n=1 Tax=Aminobacter niigataensis TaxID=83265 RepID=A0ABR6L1V0_9HYPH|nr:hypothetical protein [Aminobacter niigataensis]MBB4650782.1 hypothetical protein [Aminobacter niigataensis]
MAVTNILVGTELYDPAEAVSAALKWWEAFIERIESGAADARQAAQSGKRMKRR